jgi:hypothetical protein
MQGDGVSGAFRAVFAAGVQGIRSALLDLLQVEAKPALWASEAHAAEGSRVGVNQSQSTPSLTAKAAVYEPHTPRHGLAAAQ